MDHIATLDRSRANVKSAGVIHRVENLSDHEPVYLVYSSTHDELSVEESNYEEKNESKPKPNWKAASEDQKLDYNDVAFRKLLNINIPQSLSTCTNPKCEDENHLSEADSYMKAVLDNIAVAAEETIPKTKSKPNCTKRKEMAGWKDYVEPYQDSAKFWFSIWASAGRPMNTALHGIMKKTRNKFHHQIRKCKRVEHFIKNRKLIENRDDPLFNISSDLLKNAPEILRVHLANIVKSFFIHGHFSNFLLLATLIPLVKDKLGELNASSNYRSIAISY